MIAAILIAVGTLFAEVGVSLGKYEVAHKKESIYTLGFLSVFWTLIFLIATGLYRDNFIFSLESLPTLAAQVVLELTLVPIALHAVIKADRSTFSFLRLLTLPLYIYWFRRVYYGLRLSLYSRIYCHDDRAFISSISIDSFWTFLLPREARIDKILRPHDHCLGNDADGCLVF